MKTGDIHDHGTYRRICAGLARQKTRTGEEEGIEGNHHVRRIYEANATGSGQWG